MTFTNYIEQITQEFKDGMGWVSIEYLLEIINNDQNGFNKTILMTSTALNLVEEEMLYYEVDSLREQAIGTSMTTDEALEWISKYM